MTILYRYTAVYTRLAAVFVYGFDFNVQNRVGVTPLLWPRLIYRSTDPLNQHGNAYSVALSGFDVYIVAFLKHDIQGFFISLINGKVYNGESPVNDICLNMIKHES